jgi:hypothetical protein
MNSEEEAVLAQFPEFHNWVMQQEAELEQLAPEPSPSLVDEAELSRRLQDSAKWLKRQDHKIQKNDDWLRERLHWADPAPFSPEDAEVQDIIQDLHLYHVQDDSDLERIKAMWQNRASTHVDSTPPPCSLSKKRPAPIKEDIRQRQHFGPLNSQRNPGHGETPLAQPVKKRCSGLRLLLRNSREDLESLPQASDAQDIPEGDSGNLDESLNLADDGPADDQPASGKSRRPKVDRGVTQFERYVVIEDQLKNQRVEPIDHLPAAVASAINTAIDQLFDQYEERASRVTDPDNSKGYVDSNVCVWQHIISKAKAKPTRGFGAGCTTCGKSGRPCTLLQRRKDSEEVVLVTYPRHEKHAPQDAKVTDIAYWV